GGDEAAPAGERIPEGVVGGDGLDTGVDVAAFLRVVDPVGEESPAHGPEETAVVPLGHDEDRVGGDDVPALLQTGCDHLVHGEVLGIEVEVAGQGEAPAHAAPRLRLSGGLSWPPA